MALWYASGLEVFLQRASPGDEHPLEADFAPEIPVSFRTVAGIQARVIPGGIQGPDQPGSVKLLFGDVVVTLYGWPRDLTTEQLVEIADTIR